MSAVAENVIPEVDYDSFIFKREQNEYNIHLHPVKEYIKQGATYLNKINNTPYHEGVNTIKQLLKKYPIKNPTVKFNHRQENGDVIKDSDSLTNYISSTMEKGEVIVPSFTTYIHPSIRKSLHADFLSINISKRKFHKKESFRQEQSGEMAKATYHEVMQKTLKIANNSLSGAYATKSTVLFNPSAHYTLTSITRCVASIGNSVTESVIAGNKHFRTPATVINYITALLTNVHSLTVETAIKLFDLHIPTVQEVMENIIYSSKDYWTDSEQENVIYTYLTKLTGTERAIVLYSNDLWSMKKYNDSTIRKMIELLSKRITFGSTNNLRDLNTAPEGVVNLAHIICMEDIRGKNTEYDKMAKTDVELLNILASTTKHLSLTLMHYKPLFKAFFGSDVMPTSIAYIREMLRDVIVLSDTDSTCASYDAWTEWYFGKHQFDSEALAVSGAVMTINTQIMDHMLKLFARNMNVDVKLVELLKMKNEFGWSIFTSANMNKHYFARTDIKEGNIFMEAKLELKGVHLIASAIDQALVKEAHDLLKEINTSIGNGVKLKLYDIVCKVANLERVIIDKVVKGDVSVFKNEQIKTEAAYKNEADKSPYLHHLLWTSVFSDKYGHPGEPTYSVISVPLVVDKPAALKLFLSEIKDPLIRERWIAFMDKYSKETIGTFRPPLSIVGNVGLPEEVLSIIDTRKVVLNNMNIFYIILEAIGFYRKPSFLVSEMGY